MRGRKGGAGGRGGGGACGAASDPPPPSLPRSNDHVRVINADNFVTNGVFHETDAVLIPANRLAEILSSA